MSYLYKLIGIDVSEYVAESIVSTGVSDSMHLETLDYK